MKRQLAAGWRVFRCDGCGQQWEATSRDHASPSGEECDCGEWVSPHDSRPDATLRVNEFGNLVDGRERKLIEYPVESLTGHPMDHGWVPHRPETWKYHFASLRKPVEMWYYNPRATTEEEKFNKVLRDAGTRVKIVMVSRFGDVGITDDLAAENGYGARVLLDDLCDFDVVT